MAKIGRPTKEDARVHKFRLRMNNEELDRLERLCKITGMNKTDTMRLLMEKYDNEEMNRR